MGQRPALAPQPAGNATIPAPRLLVFDVHEGWEPPCGFLGCPIPGISFPRLNSTREFVNEEWRPYA